LIIFAQTNTKILFNHQREIWEILILSYIWKLKINNENIFQYDFWLYFPKQIQKHRTIINEKFENFFILNYKKAKYISNEKTLQSWIIFPKTSPKKSFYWHHLLIPIKELKSKYHLANLFTRKRVTLKNCKRFKYIYRWGVGYLSNACFIETDHSLLQAYV
jgi:hypothetical protein